ncbi:hypothetical protein [Nocardia thraciensis]
MPQPARAPRHRTASPAADIPSTLWAAGPDPIPPTSRWPHPLLTRAVHEFSRPGDQVLLALPATGKRLRVLPAGSDAALTVIDSLDRHALLDHPGSDSGTPPAAEDSALVLASLLPDCDDPAGAGARIADLAAARLTGGGLLVVFTRCTHTPDGTLLDPTGAVVTAAQAADLLFLQHIVAAPITGDTVADSTTVDAADDVTGRPHHAVVHTDVLVLMKCTYEPGDTADLAA